MHEAGDALANSKSLALLPQTEKFMKSNELPKDIDMELAGKIHKMEQKFESFKEPKTKAAVLDDNE